MRQRHPVASVARAHPGGPAAHLALALCLILAAPPLAAAHFILQAPASWREQGPLGGPQKLGPCGDEGDGAQTGIVTAYSAGDTITINEVIFHPGHYRVALAARDRSELPAAPAVAPGDTPCGSVPIEDPPVFPVLADGILPHASPFPGPQSFQVTLPSSVTCERCTLQVLEFMSDHALPCFYHHCADISISAPTANECATDAECADDSICTIDSCDTATHTCAHIDADPASVCDDGNACTQDICTAAEGCAGRALTLADATPGFIGTVQVAACAAEDVPPAVTAGFGKADTFIAQATETPEKARRFLRRAAKKLKNAAQKAAKASGRRISPECGGALDTALHQARTRVDCLLAASP